ncbi:hypothetical protein JRQ81_001916 [Phrynocephalus forsythii]|uniref:Uncharacterized protein n=1 Tax=Phrynocephalus forsythii TaxID=171643 RepID=A0A9Q0Y9W3_9SAUR|nr:hypothetical protein JRQ81_001916 [Phrynocephalus forsythii]
MGPCTSDSNGKSVLQDPTGAAVDDENAEHRQGPPSPDQEVDGKEPRAQEALSNGLKQDSLPSDLNRETSLPPEGALFSSEEDSQSDSVLRALRKQDKEQAETLVLEGKVQVLVVQSTSRVFSVRNVLTSPGRRSACRCIAKGAARARSAL